TTTRHRSRSSHFPYTTLFRSNKFFDALAMGKAILVNQKGWIYNLVKEKRLGLYHSPENALKTIRELEGFAENHQLLQAAQRRARSEEHTSELQSREKLVCRLL